MTPETLSGLAVHLSMGVALAACAGLRAFLPLFLLGVASRLGFVGLSDTFTWLGGNAALVVFGIAVTLEVLADKIPFVDHVLDGLETVIKPFAGALLMASLVDGWGPLGMTVASIVVGGAFSGGVHLAKSNLRLASSAVTGGVGNPVLSAAEDAGALFGTAAALVVPLVAGALAVAGVVALVLVARRWRRRERLPALG